MTENKQAQHIHTLLEGRRTGPDIRDLVDPNRHWHEVAGERTSTDPYGEGHTHQFQGDTTSGPMPIQENDPMSNQDDENTTGDQGGTGMHEDDQEQGGMHFSVPGANGITMESKIFGGKAIECKEEAVNGVPVGIIKGYIATWDLDRGLDRFVQGAFAESLNDFRAKNRPIRFKDHHDRTIGGFPIISVFEDEKGLFGQGEVNLEVQQGREAFALAKQGILTDFSIGFTVIESEVDEDIRIISKAIVWEGSIVDEPMNPAATVTEVKSVVPFQDLPLADRSRPWDSSAAIARVREFTDSGEVPTAAYRRAFVWFDSAESNLFGAYKLPIADIVGGRMVAVPRGIFAASAAMLGARGGVDIPEADRPRVIRHLERYYVKMGLESPFKEKQFFVSDDVKTWTVRELEQFLKGTGGMSKGAAKVLAARIVDKEELQEYSDQQVSQDWDSVLKEIVAIKL